MPDSHARELEVYRMWLRLILFTGLFYLCGLCSAAAQSTVIYSDDFESGVSGWSNNNSAFNGAVSRFLGRFDNSPSETSRSFTLPSGTDHVDVEFDFYRFDSWDNSAQYGFDRFEIEIDGVQIFSLNFSGGPSGFSGTSGSVDWTIVATTPYQNIAYGSGQSWLLDRLYRVTITVNDPGATLDITLRTAITQGGNDESGGYDNFNITAFPTLPDVTANKTVAFVGGGYAIPGSLVDYTITINNIGGEVDASSLVLTDILPPDIELFTGNLDGAGQPVDFTDDTSGASGLSCCTAAQISYSSDTSPPITYGYTPVSDYDPAVTHIQIAPSGTLRNGESDPVDISFRFRARIK